MVLNQYGRSVVGIDFADVEDFVNDDITRFQLILPLYLCFCHVARARNVLVEIVGMSGADVGDILTSLCKCGGIGRVGVYHALNVGECLVQYKVGRGVR